MPTRKNSAQPRALNPKTALEDYARYLYAQCGLGNTTVANHVSTMRRLFPKLGLRPTQRQADDLLMQMRKAGKSYAHQTNTSIALERYGELLGTPIRLGRPRQPQLLPQTTLTEAEVARLISACRTKRQRAIFALLAYSGIRNLELCQLRIRDLDQGNQVLRVHGTKTYRDRAIAVAPPCLAVLNDYLRTYTAKDSDLLFLTERRGRELEPQDLRKLVKAIATRAGIEKRVHPHLFRHSLATNLLDRGSGVLAIKEQLGHVNLSTTMRYLHSMPGRLQAEYRMHCPSYV